LKIYPAFYAFLLLTTPLVPRQEYGRMLPEFLFLQQYLPHVWQHTWSLSVEETFYIGIPFAIAVLYRAKLLWWFPVVCLSIIVVLTILRLLGAEPIRLEGLALGSGLGYYHAFHETSFRRAVGWWLAPVALVSFAPAFLFRQSHLVFTGNTVAFGCVVCWAAIRPGVSLFGLNSIGRYSYSIYLWHMPIAMFYWFVKPMSAIGFVLNVFSTLAVGIGMAKLIDIPSLKLRDKFFPSLSSPDSIRDNLLTESSSTRGSEIVKETMPVSGAQTVTLHQ